MAAIAAHKLQIIRTLVETAPDAALRSLELALSSAGATGSLAAVRGLVEDETAHRFVRNNILGPIVPLCATRREGQVQFPSAVLPRLWRALRAVAPSRVEEAAAKCNPWDLEQGVPDVFDDLCKTAAAGLRDPENAAFDSVRSICDPEQLAMCLQLSAITRSCLPKLSEWVSRMSDERAAAARLAYRDACRISDDAGPLMLDILSAHLPDDWRILRVISAVMDRPSDRYLASSEVKAFGERVLAEIDAAIVQVETFNFSDGERAGRAAAQALQHAPKPFSAALLIAAIRDPKVVDDRIEVLMNQGLGDARLDGIAHELVNLRMEADHVETGMLRGRLASVGYDAGVLALLERSASGVKALDVGQSAAQNPEEAIRVLWSQAFDLLIRLTALERAVDDAKTDLVDDSDFQTLLRLKTERDAVKRLIDSGGWTDPEMVSQVLH